MGKFFLCQMGRFPSGGLMGDFFSLDGLMRNFSLDGLMREFFHSWYDEGVSPLMVWWGNFPFIF